MSLFFEEIECVADLEFLRSVFEEVTVFGEMIGFLTEFTFEVGLEDFFVA